MRSLPRPLRVLAAVLAASIACILPACDSGARSSAATAGATATEGSYVALHYDARVTAVGGAPRSDPTFDSTRRGEPFLAKLGKTPLLPGLLEGLLGMKEGERRRITIPPEKGYGALGKPPVPPDATLEYEVELVDVFTRLPSGLQVRVVTDGTGAVPAKGDRVIVNHRGWLLETGREVTSSRMTGRSLEFELGQGLAIAGLEEALLQMKAGSRWIVAIPPELAYGEMGRFPLLLPGNEVLFDVELLGTRPR